MVIISQHMDARSTKISEFSDNMFFGNSMSKITFSAKMKKIKILSKDGGSIFYQSKIWEIGHLWPKFHISDIIPHCFTLGVKIAFFRDFGDFRILKNPQKKFLENFFKIFFSIFQMSQYRGHTAKKSGRSND